MDNNLIIMTKNYTLQPKGLSKTYFGVKTDGYKSSKKVWEVGQLFKGGNY